MKKVVLLMAVAALAAASCSTKKEEATPTTVAAAVTSAAATSTSAAAATTTAAAAPATTAAAAGSTTVAAATTVATTVAPAKTFPPVVDPRANGVTAASIKVGVIYPDLAGVKAILGIDHGDYQAAFNAAFDAINSAGGVNGRKLVPAYAPVFPGGGDNGTASCTKLVKDEKVFVILGTYIDDNADCIVGTNSTPLLGGSQSAAVLAKAKALWLTTEPSDASSLALKSLIDSGVFKGKKVGVVTIQGFDALYKSGIKPLFDAAGVNVVDVGYVDVVSGASDPNAMFAATETLSLKFQSEGIDLMYLNVVGTTFPTGLARTTYRPQLVFSDLGQAVTYSGGKGSDLSVMTEAVSVGAYDSGELFAELGEPTKSCLANQAAKLGVTLKKASELSKGDPNYLTSSLNACRYTQLLEAVLKKAGPELNVGTFTTAGQNLGSVLLAGSPTPSVFDKDHTDGTPKSYIYKWDTTKKVFVPRA